MNCLAHTNRCFRPFVRAVVLLVIVSFVTGMIGPSPASYAQPSSHPWGANPTPGVGNGLGLPAPGTMVTVSPAFFPPVLKGVRVYPAEPFKFDFVVDSGDARLDEDELKQESEKLIKYFLASLAIPKENLWVNLSPYEQDLIIPEEFGTTEMGRDLLAQDYLLKQITASLIYPEDELGRKFWDKIRKEARERYGVADLPVNTFNKVWIVPDKAVVYEKGDVAFVLESHLKVMLEEDYVALKANSSFVVSIPSSVEERNTDDGRRMPGGIDLNEDNWELETQKEAVPQAAPLIPEPAEYMEIEGLVPVIYGIIPLPSVGAFLGMAEDEENSVEVSRL
jgi:hypothetical protein